MSPPKPPPTPLSAPDLIGPTSILQQPISGPRSSRRARNRPYSHAHLELDFELAGTKLAPGIPGLNSIQRLFRERELEESADLVVLGGVALHAFSSQGFRRVDHWEVSPGGWLPLPGHSKASRPGEETVGELLKALESGAWKSVAGARTFAVRLSDTAGNRADVVVRRVHRQRRHSISLDLWGSWTKAKIGLVTGSIGARLPLAHSTLTKFQYA